MPYNLQSLFLELILAISFWEVAIYNFKYMAFTWAQINIEELFADLVFDKHNHPFFPLLTQQLLFDV